MPQKKRQRDIRVDSPISFTVSRAEKKAREDRTKQKGQPTKDYKEEEISKREQRTTYYLRVRAEFKIHNSKAINSKVERINKAALNRPHTL